MLYKDFEICQTNFNHPDIKTGMHTNGKAGIWIRPAIKVAEWAYTDEHAMHKVRKNIDEQGINYYFSLQNLQSHRLTENDP